MKKTMKLIALILCALTIAGEMSAWRGRGYGRGWGRGYYGRGYGRGWGRGYWGRPRIGFGIGLGLGYPYGWNSPYWYDYYYPRRTYVYVPREKRSPWQDDIGEKYWEIVNSTDADVTVKGIKGKITLKSGQKAKLSHDGSFNIEIIAEKKGHKTQRINTDTEHHYLNITVNEDGKLQLLAKTQD